MRVGTLSSKITVLNHVDGIVISGNAIGIPYGAGVITVPGTGAGWVTQMFSSNEVPEEITPEYGQIIYIYCPVTNSSNETYLSAGDASGFNSSFVQEPGTISIWQCIYSPSFGTRWQVIGCTDPTLLLGPTGADGSFGTMGNQGATGSTGPDGNPGSDGIAGGQGYTGPDVGGQGDTGPDGPKGPTGT